MWSCPGDMPKILPRSERHIIRSEQQDHINIIILLSV